MKDEQKIEFRHDDLSGPDDPVSGRRRLLGFLIGLITTAITGVMGAITGRYAIEPALAVSKETEWTDAGAIDLMPEGEPVKRNVVVTQDAGWGRFNSQRLIWVIKKGEALTVFSAVCPHLGCTVNRTSNGFICPCHGSAWNAEGRKLSGPSPRDLDTLQYTIEDGLLKVRYRHFRQGVSEKEAVS
ncbi:MAG: ubiquinol-cytochrome c reductase iron-sulfur subunit [Acidobacteriota bacterium]